MCYNPKPCIMQKYTKINEKTGEVYETKRPIFKYWDYVNANNALSDQITWLPCGKCEQCRCDQASQQSTRAVIESQNWPVNAFLTLTYDNIHLPKGRTLVKRDLQLFWKRLRKRGYKIRYMACGEYGPRTLRPHYHAIVFNYWPKDAKYYKDNTNGDQLFTSEELDQIWGNGYVVVGPVTYESCAYVARYVMKKAYGLDKDWNTKRGRCPEFTLSSRRPGIGLSGKDMEQVFRNFGYIIPTKNGAQLKSIPTYLRNKLREEHREWYTKKSEERARALKEIARARKTDLNYFEYQKIINERTKARLKKLDTRQDFE